MLAYQSVTVIGYQFLEVQVHLGALHIRESAVHHILASVGREFGTHGVKVHRLALDNLCHSQPLVGCDAVLAVVGHAGIVHIVGAHTVVVQRERVLAALKLGQTLALGIVGQTGGIHQTEVAVKVEHDALGGKRLAAVRHRGGIAEALGLHILKPLTAPQREQQVFLLCR